MSLRKAESRFLVDAHASRKTCGLTFSDTCFNGDHALHPSPALCGALTSVQQEARQESASTLAPTASRRLSAATATPVSVAMACARQTGSLPEDGGPTPGLMLGRGGSEEMIPG